MRQLPREQQQEEGEEHHPCHAECAVAEVHRKKRRDRRQPRLRGEKLGLERVARDERAEVEREEHDGLGREAEQQREDRPRHERRARAEDRQRVEQCDEKGEQQGIALAHEERADKKL